MFSYGLSDTLSIARRWLSTLTTARITRWGGMISTPDAVLQAVIKRALIESNCPSQLISELMENAHERRWPPGLCTLETRQQNRRLYETIICKRIPGKPNRVCCCSRSCTPLHAARISIYWDNSAFKLISKSSPRNIR